MVDRLIQKRGQWSLIQRIREYCAFARACCILHKGNMYNTVNLINSKPMWDIIVSEYENYNLPKQRELLDAWLEFLEISDEIQKQMERYKMVYNSETPSFEYVGGQKN